MDKAELKREREYLKETYEQVRKIKETLYDDDPVKGSLNDILWRILDSEMYLRDLDRKTK